MATNIEIGASPEGVQSLALKRANRHGLIAGAAMTAAGVQTSVHYPAAHRFSMYAGGASLPRTEWAADHELTLPLFASLTEAQQDQVVEAVQLALRQ